MGGYQQLVRGEAFRGKFRNSYEKPEPFEPGQVTPIKYTLPDAYHTFRRGHRIMIQVQEFLVSAGWTATRRNSATSITRSRTIFRSDAARISIVESGFTRGRECAQ